MDDERTVGNTEGGTITGLLSAWRRSGTHADQALLEEVYGELRRKAHQFLRGERTNHTFEPSDLIHETYLRLKDRRQTAWHDRRHFFATAAQCMRRILIEHARRRSRTKHGAGLGTLLLDEARLPTPERAPEFVALDDALKGLEGVDLFKARLVELRFFGGFSIPETAEILGCSHATIERHYRLAQAWLYAEMKSAPNSGKTEGSDR